MALNKKIWGLSALVVGGILFMAWLAGLLHFGKIAPGLTPITGPPPQGPRPGRPGNRDSPRA